MNAAHIEEAFEHYHLLPVGADSKATLVRWKDRTFTKEQLLFNARRGGNTGARVGDTPSGIRVCVIDRDDREMESWRTIQRFGIAHRCNMVTVTANGNSHYWFALPDITEELRTRIKFLVDGKKLAIDWKLTGYVLLPGSKLGGKEYRLKDGKGFKRPEDLGPIPESFLDWMNSLTARKEVTNITPAQMTDRTVLRVRNYIRHILARNHSSAHGQAYRCACKIADLISDFAMAMQIYREWNAGNAVDEDGTTPFPFSERELEHKMTDAFARSRK